MTQVSVPEWLPEWPERGDRSLRRVSASALGSPVSQVCPEQVAKKSYVGVWPDTPFEVFVAPEFEGFWLGLARDAVLASLPRWDSSTPPAATVEEAMARAVRDSGKTWKDPSLAVARRATAGYLVALADIRAGEDGWDDARFTSDVVVSVSGATTVEWWGWAIHVIRDAGRIRETHLLRYRVTGARPLPEARVAAVAGILADGVLAARGTRNSDPYDPFVTQPPAPERVVVREFGLLEDAAVVLIDQTTAEARARFAALVPGVVAVLAGGAYTPGARCAECPVKKVCTGVAKMPGLLGVAAYSPWTRSTSPADLTAHAACPLRVHLARDLGLPRAVFEDSFAAARGLRIHEWLDAAHSRGIPCNPDDVAEVPVPDVAAGLGWSENEWTETRPWLLGHLANCGLAGASDVRTEHDVTVFDTDTNVVFSTRVDLAYRKPGIGRVLRESKSMTFNRIRDSLGRDDLDVIALFPQVAFAIASLAQGWDPITASPLDTSDGYGLVEFEILSQDDGNEFVLTFDPTDVDIAMTARIALAQAIDARITDREHKPAPGAQCRWCPMREWCPAASGTSHAESSVELHVVVAQYAEAEAVDDDEPPF